MTKIAELSIYYQDCRYSWHELCQRLTVVSHKLSPLTHHCADENAGNSSLVLAVPGQERFFSTILILLGFIRKWTIFPLSNESSNEEKTEWIKQLNAISVAVFNMNNSSLSYDTHFTVDVTNNETNKQSMALAIATSGSQSKAKIALLSRGNVIAHCQNFIKTIPVGNDSVWLNCLPLNHIAGVIIIYRCWFNNATMLLHDDFDVKKIWADLHVHRATHISLVPRMLSRLLDYAQHKSLPESLKYLLVGGDKLSNRLYQRAMNAGWPIYISYGMTEATSTIAIGRTPESLKLLHGFDAQVTSEGTLEVKGPMVMSDYAALNAGKMHNCWLQTNDLAKIKDRQLTITGRNDHMIISAGKNIAPEYIEELLSRSPFVEDIAIGKVLHPEWGHSIVALVCGDIVKLKPWLSEHVKSCFRPRILIELQQIPRNSLGKIDRKELQILVEKHVKN